ncbi:hypothetical protein SRHO_G00091830 [Serrasalmus rhombeus]
MEKSVTSCHRCWDAGNSWHNFGLGHDVWYLLHLMSIPELCPHAWGSWESPMYLDRDSLQHCRKWSIVFNCINLLNKLPKSPPCAERQVKNQLPAPQKTLNLITKTPQTTQTRGYVQWLI